MIINLCIVGFLFHFLIFLLLPKLRIIFKEIIMMIVKQKINLNTRPGLPLLITILVRDDFVFTYLVDIDVY